MATVTEQTAYGYLLDETGQLTDPMEVTLKSDANGSEQMTLTGQNGISNGTVVQSLSVKNAVSRGSTERKRLYKAHLKQTYVTFRYRIDDEQYETTGKITSTTLGSGVQKANTFDFDFKGFPKLPA